jgi:thiol:disulfide interchange protein
MKRPRRRSLAPSRFTRSAAVFTACGEPELQRAVEAAISSLPEDADDPNAPQIAWLTDEEAALAKAQSEGKPVLIDFGARWCEGCKRLDRETFPSTKVRKESQRFVALRIDLSEDDGEAERIRRKYRIGGLPVLLLLDKRGNEVERLVDFVEPAELVATMKCSAPTRTASASRSSLESMEMASRDP